MMPRVATIPRIVEGWHELPFAAALALDTGNWDGVTDAVTSPFQRRGWFAAWNAVAPAHERAAAFALARYDGDGVMCGLLPLARRRRTIGIAGAKTITWAADDVGCPDHLDLPLADDAAVDDAVDALLRLDWDLLMLGNLIEGAPRASRLAQQLISRGCHVTVRSAETCPRLELPETWDEYLSTQSPTRRQTIRRKERKLARDYAMTLHYHDADTFDDGWNTLNALHCERWAGQTAFSPLVAEMHREFARSLSERDALWLTTLELDGRPAAAWYGFADGDTVYFFQSGRSAQHENDSVGQVLMGMMIRRAIEQGFRHFDFLRGDEPYKASWTSERRTTWELCASRAGPRGAWLRRCRALGLQMRVGRRYVKRALTRWTAK